MKAGLMTRETVATHAGIGGAATHPFGSGESFSMDKRIRIAVVDDHPLFREGVAHTLRSGPDIDVVAEAATSKEAIESGMTHAPDIMLLDVSMPGGGIEAAREVRRNSAIVK